MDDPARIWRTAYQHPTDWDQTYDPLSLPAMFEETAHAHPNAWLIDFLGRKYSYAETLSGVNRVA